MYLLESHKAANALMTLLKKQRPHHVIFFDFTYEFSFKNILVTK